MKKIILIAEIGENYLGNINYAKKMISQSKKCGADFAKFQSYNEACIRLKDPEYGWFKKVSLTDKNHFILKNFCKKKKIKFLSAPFSMERAEFLCEKLKIKDIKVASGKMTDLDLLKYLNKKCSRVFLSTGMSNLNEIRKSVKVLNNVDVKILHCVSEYPLNFKNANLKAIQTLKKNFPGYDIGYSDHCIGNVAALTAVALGAVIIEKHFTLNKKFKGTDHILSATENELKELRKEIDKIHVLLGDGVKKPSKNELKILKFVRNRFKN